MVLLRRGHHHRLRRFDARQLYRADIERILGLYGIVVVALITSIIVNFYGEMKKDDTSREQNKQ